MALRKGAPGVPPASSNRACRRKRVRPPSGPLWVHEIKHDGFRLMVRREGSRVRCYTKGGYDWADRFPLSLKPLRYEARYVLTQDQVDGLARGARQIIQNK